MGAQYYTNDEYIELAREWKKQNELAETYKTKDAKAKAIKRRNRAADKIMRSLDKFIISLVNKRTHRFPHLQDDCIAEARALVVTSGLRCWNEETAKEKGAAFVSYMSNWVYHACGRYIDNNFNVIRIPIHKMAELKKLIAAGEEIPEDMRIYNPQILDIHHNVANDQSESSDGKELTLEDMLLQQEATQDTDVITKDLAEKLFSILSEKEAHIFQRVVIDGDTLEETAKPFGLSRERMRQINNKSKAKMRKLAEKIG